MPRRSSCEARRPRTRAVRGKEQRIERDASAFECLRISGSGPSLRPPLRRSPHGHASGSRRGCCPHRGPDSTMSKPVPWSNASHDAGDRQFTACPKEPVPGSSLSWYTLPRRRTLHGRRARKVSRHGPVVSPSRAAARPRAPSRRSSAEEPALAGCDSPHIAMRPRPPETGVPRTSAPALDFVRRMAPAPIATIVYGHGATRAAPDEELAPSAQPVLRQHLGMAAPRVAAAPAFLV